MLNRVRTFVLGVSFAFLTLFAISATAAAQSNHTLTLQNNSGFDIYEIHMSSIYDGSWERDLLGRHVLSSGNSFDITNIASGRYDIKVVDEDGDACILRQVPVYQDRSWNLTPLGLVGCEFHQFR
jgi:hypothetical protein